MKVIKVTNKLSEQLDTIDSEIRGKKRLLGKDGALARKAILEIKKSHGASEPIEFQVLGELFSRLNTILRKLITKKKNFQDFTILLEEVSKTLNGIEKKGYYDFFKLCGNCSSCCESPRVFSFEHKFIDKYRKFLGRKRQSYFVRNNPAIGRHRGSAPGKCGLFDVKTKKCLAYENRPLDCMLFPFSFVIRKMSGDKIKIYPREYVFLIKATKCEVADRLSFEDSLEALEIVCFILSKISLKEAKQYSDTIDPRNMQFNLCVPYEERNNYYRALKKISAVKPMKIG